MPTAQVGSALGPLDLVYEVQGQGEPLLLVMGLGAQRVLWDRELRSHLVAKGFQVISYDARDIGESSRVTGEVPSVPKALAARILGQPIRTQYGLADLADDAVALLDHLEISRAHVFGISMGGMVAQHLGFSHPSRISSIASVMSTTGAFGYLPAPRALRAILRKPARTALEFEEGLLAGFAIIGSKTMQRNEASLRDMARIAWSRGPSPEGAARQFVAILADGDRTERLRRVVAPTVVLHGTEDPLIPIAAGRATARAIANAWWVPIVGMGHDLPAQAFPILVEAIAANAARA